MRPVLHALEGKSPVIWKKASTKDLGARKLEESSESNEVGEESGQEWMMRSSTLKVVPPKHAKPMTETKRLSSGAKVTRNGGPLRLEWNLHLNACGLRLRKKLRWEPGGKTTKASDQLELVSLKESIIQKAWAGWEEGLRLGHRKWEIGEATVMMESTNDQLILTLRLTEGEHVWFKNWTMQYLV